MSNLPMPIPAARSTTLDTSSITLEAPPSSLWDRISIWASENKALVYTIAGVAVVMTGAGAVYYLADSRRGAVAEEKRRASKKERRKAKKEKDEKGPEIFVPPKETTQPGIHIYYVRKSSD